MLVVIHDHRGRRIVTHKLLAVRARKEVALMVGGERPGLVAFEEYEDSFQADPDSGQPIAERTVVFEEEW